MNKKNFFFVLKGLRAQIDRSLYKQNLQQFLSNYKNLLILEGSVEDLLLHKKTDDEGFQCTGVVLGESSIIYLIKMHF